MNILLWRSWKPLYEYPATFSSLAEHSIGGTCSQLLWHARNLINMGHQVQVLGASAEDITEEQVDFVGALDRSDQERLIKSKRINSPDVIFLEGGYAAVMLLRAAYPKSKIVHIGQNIDPAGYRRAFAIERYVDAYAFVGPGQMADYSVRFPHLRHKFLLVRNIVPWNWLYKDVPSDPVEDRVIWIGAWGKKGLRQWAEVMERVLKEHPTYKWTLYGPSYGIGFGGLPPQMFEGLDLPKDRIEVKSLPLQELMRDISTARVVCVSLGNECGPISVLDAHVMGRPVLSGNDMVYKYSNPEGTGLRVTTPQEGYNALTHLLKRPELCDQVGALGKDFVLAEFSEPNQYADLTRVLQYLAIKNELGQVADNTAPRLIVERVEDLKAKIKRKRLALTSRLAH